MPKRTRGGNSRKRKRSDSGAAPRAIVKKAKTSAKKRKSPAEGMKLSKAMKELVNREINKDTGYQFVDQNIAQQEWRYAHQPLFQDPFTTMGGFMYSIPPIYHEDNASIPAEYQDGRQHRTQNRIRGVACKYRLNMLFPFGQRPTPGGTFGQDNGNELSSFLDTLHVRVFLISDKTAQSKNEQREAWLSNTGVTPMGRPLLFRANRPKAMEVLPTNLWYNREYKGSPINRERFVVHDEKSFTIKRGVDVSPNNPTQPTNMAHNVIYAKGDVEKVVNLRWKIKGKIFKFADNDQTEPIGTVNPFIVCLITNNRSNMNGTATATPGFDAPYVRVSGSKVFKFENFD